LSLLSVSLRRVGVGIVLLSVPLLVSACSSGHPSAHTPPSVPKGASPPAGPSDSLVQPNAPKSGVTPSGATVPRCTIAQLVATQTSNGLSSGQDVAVFAFQNRSKHACALSGFSSITLLGASGPVSGVTISDGGAVGATSLTNASVTLAASGGLASFAASWPLPTAGESCAESQNLQLTPPGLTTTVTISSQITVCGGTIHVSPLQPNVLQQG
jgi:hypothetical protein